MLKDSDKMSLINLKKEYRGHRKYQLINYHWRNFREKLSERKHSKWTVGIMIAIMSGMFIYAFWGSIVESLSWWLTFVLPGGGFIFGCCLVVLSNRKGKSRLNEFNFKKLAYAGLIILGLMLLLWTPIAVLIWKPGYLEAFRLRVIVDVMNWFNMGFVVILVLYIANHRVLGAGEFQLGLIKLTTDVELVPKNDKEIMKNLNAMIKGLDDWCSEKLDARIENIDEFKKDWFTSILMNFPAFKEKLERICTQELIDKLYKNEKEDIKGWDNVKTLSAVLKQIQETFATPDLEFKLRFYNERLRDTIKRNLGKAGILSTLFGAISGIAGFIILFI